MSQILKLTHENQQLKRQISQYKQVLGVSPFIDDSILKGGYRVVKTITDRDKIDCCHRKLGMKVLVIGEDLSFKEYILKTDNCKENTWEEINVTIEENEVFLTEDYSELSENLTTQKELNLVLKQLILNLQPQIDNIFIEVTKTQLDVLISENKLEPNRLYKITGVESWCFSQHLIKAIYLKAITNNTLESEGIGEFYTPKYNDSDSNLGIWKGKLLANGMIDSATYNIGDKVIWGNLFWENISGSIGNNIGSPAQVKVENHLSETDWQLITPNDDESLYNIQFDSIKYDFQNDYINYRADSLGNIYELSYNTLFSLFPLVNSVNVYYVNGISLFQWGKSNVNNNFINNSIVLNCNYNTYFFKSNTFVENSRIYDNNFLGVQIKGNNFKNSVLVGNYLKTFGGIFNNTLDGSQISSNRYYLEISGNNLSNNSQIANNNDNNIIVNYKYTIIKDNILDNNSTISNNVFVEEGKEVNSNIKSIHGNELINNCSINNNTIKNGSKIVNHNLSYFSTINGNTLDTEASIYNNQVTQNSKINNNILTGFGRIYANQLDDASEITLCKLRIYPATFHSSGINGNRLFLGKILNVDLGNIVNPEGTNHNDPNFSGNVLSLSIIENLSVIKDLTFPNSGGKFIQFVKINGYSEFKNITVNDSIRNVNFINTIFNETSDYSKLIEGSGYQTNGFTKTYIDGVLLQDKFDEKQDILTNPVTGTGTTNYLPKFTTSGIIGNSQIFDNGNKIGIGTNSPSNLLTIRHGDTEGLRIEYGGNNDSLFFDARNIQAYNSTDPSALKINPLGGKVGIGTTTPTEKLEVSGYVKANGFIIHNGTANQGLKANGGVFDLNTKADLDGGKVPASQLPSYVDDVLEFANLASFPATGESGKIYIAIDTNLTYRWGGSSYVVMSSSLALGETSSTAYRGDYGKVAYDHSQKITGNPHNTKVEELTDVGSETPSIEDTDIILKKEAVGGLWRKITFANFKSWFTTELAKKINIGLDTVFNFKNISVMTLTEFIGITPNLETIYFTEEQNATGWQQVRYNGLGISIPANTESKISIINENYTELDSDSTFNLINVANTKINGVFENDFVIIKFNAGVVTPATANQWFKLILKVNNAQTAVSPVFYLTESSGTVEQIAHNFSLNVPAEMVTNGATLHIKTSVAMTFNNPAISVVRIHKSTNANL